MWHKKPEINLFSTLDEAYHSRDEEESWKHIQHDEYARDGTCCEFVLHNRHYSASDAVAEIAFQRKLGFLEKGGDVDGMAASNDGFMVYASIFAQIPGVHSLLLANPILPYLLPVSFKSNRVQMKPIYNISED